MPPEPTDEELIKMIRNGNVRAMDTLIERYQKPVFNLALRMMGNRHFAEDITQEVLIKVIKSLPSYKPKNFKSYVYKITNNVIYDKMRTQQPSMSIDAEITISGQEVTELRNIIPDMKNPSPEQSLIRTEVEEIINKILMQLPPEQRQVFIMREFSNMSFREIADVCGCSMNTVLSRMQYSIKKLKKLLDGKI
ncbi:MAG: sigma-70 family RNA polymerase sigma factor [Elusimicrobiota bacterium]